jgi:hypothetical protein
MGGCLVMLFSLSRLASGRLVSSRRSIGTVQWCGQGEEKEETKRARDGDRESKDQQAMMGWSCVGHRGSWAVVGGRGVDIHGLVGTCEYCTYTQE